MAKTPQTGNIVGLGTQVATGKYAVFVVEDENGTLVTPHGHYVFNSNLGTNGLWVPAPVDANGVPQMTLSGAMTNV